MKPPLFDIGPVLFILSVEIPPWLFPSGSEIDPPLLWRPACAPAALNIAFWSVELKFYLLYLPEFLLSKPMADYWAPTGGLPEGIGASPLAIIPFGGGK